MVQSLFGVEGRPGPHREVLRDSWACGQESLKLKGPDGMLDIEHWSAVCKANTLYHTDSSLVLFIASFLSLIYGIQPCLSSLFHPSSVGYELLSTFYSSL